MSMECKIIIVTHNSQKHIQWCIDGLESSKLKLNIKIVDSGSNNPAYLDSLSSKHQLEVFKEDNIGFVKGNNRILHKIKDDDWILLLNPDARVEGEVLDKLISLANEIKYNNVGIFSVPLIRFSIDEMKSLSVFDSLGIKSSLYGKWFDVGSGEPVRQLPNEPTDISAVCGAFMLIRGNALNVCLDKSNKKGFEGSYFMYKEDIELCLRFRKNKWKVMMVNHLSAYHCRGWNKSRKDIAFWAKYHSALNDLDLAIRYRIINLPYAMSKYLWVNIVERFN
ncbi:MULTISPECIES: glycosyltransferase family 2 protein [Raoultella]|uniref:glycosyltransferase family 2 protein n=1 Tax=Raoultella TaxID=160674 RepID=UPI0004E2C35F|nr:MULTISPECIES: glycosyltransferase family 2 protein [Raoultella]KFD08385.1 family 2 glycosyl transferase [Raoultella planticola ATCC 33531]